MTLADELAGARARIDPRRFKRRLITPADGPSLAHWCPLWHLEVRGPAPARIAAYCEYVGTLITVSGVAAALGIQRKTALDYLGQLKRRGHLVTARRVPSQRRGRRLDILEWTA